MKICCYIFVKIILKRKFRDYKISEKIFFFVKIPQTFFIIYQLMFMARRFGQKNWATNYLLSMEACEKFRFRIVAFAAGQKGSLA